MSVQVYEGGQSRPQQPHRIRIHIPGYSLGLRRSELQYVPPAVPEEADTEGHFLASETPKNNNTNDHSRQAEQISEADAIALTQTRRFLRDMIVGVKIGEEDSPIALVHSPRPDSKTKRAVQLGEEADRRYMRDAKD